jgi:hypothetical protein
MGFFGVFDFSRCFQVRIDVTVEAKQLGPWRGWDAPWRFASKIEEKLSEKNTSNPMVGR